MRAVILSLFVALLITVGLSITNFPGLLPSDKAIRDRVVMLHNSNASCTGVVVESPKSHKSYVLSAGHCRFLAVNGKILADYEFKKNVALTVLEEDGFSDLLILTNELPIRGLRLGRTPELHDEVHAITHKGGKPAYRTDGEILNDDKVSSPQYHIVSKKQRKSCTSITKYSIAYSPFYGELCIFSALETIATARIIPGSSGGPLLNTQSELVGIASMTDGNFGYFVRLNDIRKFLKNY